jgi:peptidyl-dipeptidase A
MKTAVLLLGFLVAAPAAAAAPAVSPSALADTFLRFYDSVYLGLVKVSQEADWAASTDVSDAHEAARTAADTALAVFHGDRNVI